MNGLLIVDKPRGPSSHDVVAAVRRAAGTPRVGHAGTLDPMATGVLVLALGKGTRTLEYLIADDKRYDAELRLGQSTDSYDAEGQITATHDGPLPSRQAVEEALASFRGEIMQRPPIFSALKQGGEALYKKARRGEVLAVEPRAVTIYDLALTVWEPPHMGLRVHCSKGTYIRSLAHDLGSGLGVGAHLSGLRRRASGTFTLQHAHPLADIEVSAREEIEAWLLPVGTGLEGMAMLEVDEREQEALRHGKALPATRGQGVRRALSPEGELVAIVQWRDDRGWQPRKVFV